MEPFTTVLADPPWSYSDQLAMSDVKRSSGSQYSTMDVHDICALYKPIAIAGDGSRSGGVLAGYPVADVAFLFLWVTNPFLLDGSGSMVCQSWGFAPKQLITWVKGRLGDLRKAAVRVDRPPTVDETGLIYQIGLGHLTRGCTEHLIVATRGKYKSLVQDHAIPNVILAPKTSHSTKPVEQYDLIETLVPGPRLELFARSRRPFWTSDGLELPPVAEEVIAWP
jgi:N6-adenosine-specific RNA methylase IME4